MRSRPAAVTTYRTLAWAIVMPTSVNSEAWLDDEPVHHPLVAVEDPLDVGRARSAVNVRWNVR